MQSSPAAVRKGVSRLGLLAAIGGVIHAASGCGGAHASTTAGGAGGGAATSSGVTGVTSTTGSTGVGASGSGSATTSTSGAGGSSSTSGTGGAGGSPDAAKMCSPSTTAIEKYHLPPLMNLPAGVSFATDWATIPTTGGWYGEQIMDTCRMKPDGFQTWHGRAAVRAEVDPGDDPLFLGENSERAEMAFTQDASGDQVNEEVTGGTQYYATSYYFPTSWAATFYPWSVTEALESIDCSTGDQNQCNSWSHVLQFHTGTAFWGGLEAAATTAGGTQKYWLTLGSEYQLSDGGAIALGKWTDFVLEIDWSSGAIALWRRDQGSTAFTQVVSATEPTVTTVSGVYLKQGLYRGGHVNGRTDVFWIGPTARGTSFSAVEKDAFGTSDGP